MAEGAGVEEPLIQQEQEQEKEQEQDHSILKRYIYFGHFLARWRARMWGSSVGLYTKSIWPDSLLSDDMFDVLESASTALFGPIVGHWVDRLPPAKVLQLWLISQHLSFVVAGDSATALLVSSSLKLTNFPAFLSLVILTILSGAVGVLSTLARTILIKREWVAKISKQHSPKRLWMNSFLRLIDHICKLFAPVVTGYIISFVSLKASALTLASWNIISVWVEYWLFTSVYNGIPALSESNQPRDERMSKTIWRVYLQQDVVLPGIARALLFFSVPSFGTLMTAALEWQGIPAFVIGIAHIFSAVIGIVATLLYPILKSRFPTPTPSIDLWPIWSQWTFLLVCVASIWVQNHLWSAYMLIGGVALSRLGSRTFDLSVIQQMQNHEDRCVVGGVHKSLQSCMDLMGYVMRVVISDPQDFWKLILISFGAVTMVAFYTVPWHLLTRKLKELFFLVKRITRRPTNELNKTMEDRLERLEREVTNIRAFVNKQWDFMRRQQQWFTEQATYQSAYFQCLGQMSHMQVSSSGADMSQFSDFPTYSGLGFTYNLVVPDVEEKAVVNNVEE